MRTNATLDAPVPLIDFLPDRRGPFRSQRAYNNLLAALLLLPMETFVGFCATMQLLGCKPASAESTPSA